MRLHPTPLRILRLSLALLGGMALTVPVASATSPPAGAYDRDAGGPRGVDPAAETPLYVPDELLVQFRANVPERDRRNTARATRAEILETITPDGLVRVRLAPGESVLEAIDRWSRMPGVLHATPNLYGQGFFFPNDSLIADQNLGWNLNAIGAFDAWDIVTGDPDVLLAIVDSGVAYEDHDIPDYERPLLDPQTVRYRRSPDLSDAFRPGYDFVNDDAHANDDVGHGTAVATIAAGQADNVAGSAGVAFGVTILPVKVLDHLNRFRLDNLVQGIRFAADQGADIINLSLGIRVHLLRNEGVTQPELVQEWLGPLREAVRYAQLRGAIVVGAAGNDDRSEISPPASFPGVIAVGATVADGSRASYSQYGPGLTLVAPGGDFVDSDQDGIIDLIWEIGMKPGPIVRGTPARPDSFGVFPDFARGTSFAAAHVSGAVALLMSAGLRDRGRIVETLRSTAELRSGQTRRFDPQYGSGLLRVDRAVRRVVTGRTRDAAGVNSTRLASRLVSGNPARGGEAAVSFLLEAGGPARARVYDARGALVRTLLEGHLSAGSRVVRWDGRREDGTGAPSGIYFIRLESAEGAASHKVALLR